MIDVKRSSGLRPTNPIARRSACGANGASAPLRLIWDLNPGKAVATIGWYRLVRTAAGGRAPQ